MEIPLRYGREGLPVTLPDDIDIVTTRFVPGLPDEAVVIVSRSKNGKDYKSLSTYWVLQTCRLASILAQPGAL